MKIRYYGAFDLAKPIQGAKDIRHWHAQTIKRCELEVYPEEGHVKVSLPSVCMFFGGDGWHQPHRYTHLIFNGKVWVALEEEHEIPDHIRDDKYHVEGPFELDETYGKVIRDMFRIAPHKLTAREALSTSPAELERIALEADHPTQLRELDPVYKGKHLHFYVHGTGWEFVSRSKASQGVTIVAATEQKKIVLVEQHRIPIGKPVIELPAGLVGDTSSDEEDNLFSATKRELQEETGYSCEDIEVICSGSLLPGLTDEINSLCWAKKLQGREVKDNEGDDQVYEHEIKQGIESEGEETRVYDVPLTIVEEWLKEQIRKDKVVDLKVYLGVFFLRNALNV